MPIRPPVLDDRSYNDLVDELVARIPAHTPEWTNPRPGDPGRTLIELFAWLTDTLLYRVNLIPERQRLAFLRLLGVQMNPAFPARGLITVSFDAKEATAVQVMQPLATVKGKGPANFETCSEINILPVSGEAYFKRSLNDDETAAIQDLLPGLVQLYGVTGTPKPYATTPVFPSGTPDPQGFDLMKSADSSLWIALTAPKDLVEAVRKSIGSQAISVGIMPALEVPALFEDIGSRGVIPHTWEITTGSTTPDEPALLTLDVLPDSTTLGLRRKGVERLMLPRSELIGSPSADVRLNLSAGVGDVRPPRIDDAEKAASIVAWLRLRPTVKMEKLALSWAGVNAVEIEQLQTVASRIIGQSDGTANQEMALQAQSVERSSFVLQVEETGLGFLTWQPVDDLVSAGRDSRVYLLDTEAGAVRFGDGVRGKIPEAQRRVRVSLRAGGGTAGNLPAGSLNEIAGVDASGKAITQKLKAAQMLPTIGGADAETLSDAEQRIPGLFRNRDRAVTELDYKQLAMQTPGVQLGRVEVMARFKPQQRMSDVPGVVSVMVLPFKMPVGPPNPVADRPTLEAVWQYLADRKPVATELYVIGCEYVPVSITIGVSLLDGVSRETALAQVREAARAFLWPLSGGGTDGAGWRLGRSVRDREIEVIVARVPGVDTVNGVNLFTKGDHAWDRVMPDNSTGMAEVPLRSWQLPELQQVVVTIDDNAAIALDGAAEGAAPGTDDTVAIPVVPQVC